MGNVLPVNPVPRHAFLPKDFSVWSESACPGAVLVRWKRHPLRRAVKPSQRRRRQDVSHRMSSGSWTWVINSTSHDMVGFKSSCGPQNFQHFGFDCFLKRWTWRNSATSEHFTTCTVFRDCGPTGFWSFKGQKTCLSQMTAIWRPSGAVLRCRREPFFCPHGATGCSSKEGCEIRLAQRCPLCWQRWVARGIERSQENLSILLLHMVIRYHPVIRQLSQTIFAALNCPSL